MFLPIIAQKNPTKYYFLMTRLFNSLILLLILEDV